MNSIKNEMFQKKIKVKNMNITIDLIKKYLNNNDFKKAKSYAVVKPDEEKNIYNDDKNNRVEYYQVEDEITIIAYKYGTVRQVENDITYFNEARLFPKGDFLKWLESLVLEIEKNNKIEENEKKQVEMFDNNEVEEKSNSEYTDFDQKYNDLLKLKELLDLKIITKEEFEREKKKIL